MENTKSENVLVKGVQKKFSSKTVLQDIELAIRPGEIMGLLGPSGSGKTTLVKLIIGMGRPDAGEVTVLGKKMPHLETVRNIGYMAQSDALYEDLNAYHNLMFFGALYGWKGEKAEKRADEMFHLVGLQEDLNKAVKNFSGGMKRRLSLAIALFHEPKILILDEPTVGIDPVLRSQFWKEFERLKQDGRTILITTHVMDEAEHCDRLAFLQNGKILALGTPAELKGKAQAANIYEAFLFFASKGI